mmetsp:Transcript_25914/g.46855  ORF Transcript_25914/g.46855 Transcript_25914/m.46855 type:complete len:395 (-) Transcript_25914:101-1285(-)|eukprot:CAMPEP_0197642336 /NCGR_PEP_ID=MMETSP1338-20131121/16028_1 /TAXON_ID=43686 ORGANISM="Pelagodinium beii, Strain RCC1491" /NCGR_SAMPLE_ID=MMETSP1338 /ASSEMBLY_ACC=CAM_ASM_000754 /LENGTH=394 /DNA_ID=CAMNT_0043215445 /DNA_START=114 /DNA_END=1298 /DNA_ORIENTATION=-
MTAVVTAGTGECENYEELQPSEATALRLQAARKSLEAATLREALRCSRADRDAARTELQEAEQKAREASSAEELSDQLCVLRRQLSEANAQLQKVRQQTIAAQRRDGPETLELHRALQRVALQNAELTVEKDALEVKLQATQEQHAHLCQSILALKEEREVLETEVQKSGGTAAATARLEAAQHEIAELTAATAGLEVEALAMATARAEAEAKTRTAEAAEKKLREQLAAGEDAMEKAVAECKAQCQQRLQQLELSLAERREAIKEADKVTAAAMREIEGWQALHEAGEAEIKDLNGRCDRAQRQEKDAKKRAERFREDLVAAREQLEAARGERSQLLKEAETLRYTAMIPMILAVFIIFAALALASVRAKTAGVVTNTAVEEGVNESADAKAF